MVVVVKFLSVTEYVKISYVYIELRRHGGPNLIENLENQICLKMATEEFKIFTNNQNLSYYIA